MTLTDTGAHRRGFKGVNTLTHEGPSEISTPPRRGCPFHQGTTASCSSSSRQPRDTALTPPPQNSAHSQTAGQGRCHRRRPTKRPQRRLRASARGLTRKTRADGATKSPSSPTTSSSSSKTSKSRFSSDRSPSATPSWTNRSWTPPFSFLSSTHSPTPVDPVSPFRVEPRGFS